MKQNWMEIRFISGHFIENSFDLMCGKETTQTVLNVEVKSNQLFVESIYACVE